jgi:hypothetical protein
MWTVTRISDACTTVRRSSARVSASRSKPASRDQRPDVPGRGVLRLQSTDALDRAWNRKPGALEQQLAREQRSVQLAGRQHSFAHGRAS